MKQAPSPSINIVTPSFNQGMFIEQTVKSVLSQNDPYFSYWVMDGGSKDRTVHILKTFGNQINWVSKRDGGQTDAINRGMKKTISQLRDDDIVAYINSDDYYLPGSFAVVRNFFETHTDIQWVVGDSVIVNSEGKEIQKFVRWYKRILRMIPNSLWVANGYPQPSVFLRAGLVRQLGDFREDLHFVMDYEYWLRATCLVGPPGFIPQALSAFRIHTNSKGTTQFVSQFREGYEVVKRYTNNTLLLFANRLHNQCIIFIYGQIK